MSIAEQLRPPIAAPRILTLDLERLPGEVELDVWEPRDFGRINYVHPDRWRVLPRTLCASWKWHGKPHVHFAAAWDNPADEWHVAQQMWVAISDADYVVTFNGRRADLKWLRSDWAMAGMTPPTPYKDVDLFLHARREFSFESRSLSHLCDRLGLDNKDGHYNAAEAKAAAAGDEKARRRLTRYNKQDSRITEAVFDRMRPWISGLNFGLFAADDTRCCPNCGCEALAPAGFAVTGVTRYPAYRCEACGAISRGKHRSAAVPMRGVPR